MYPNTATKIVRKRRDWGAKSMGHMRADCLGGSLRFGALLCLSFLVSPVLPATDSQALQKSVNYTAILPNSQVLNSIGLPTNNLNWFYVTSGGTRALNDLRMVHGTCLPY